MDLITEQTFTFSTQINSQGYLKCPYNPKHCVQPRNFPSHVDKCRKKLPNHKLRNFAVCRFNSLHIFSVYEIGAHEMTCPNKKNILDLQKKLLQNSRVLLEEPSVNTSENEATEQKVPDIKQILEGNAGNKNMQTQKRIKIQQQHKQSQKTLALQSNFSKDSSKIEQIYVKEQKLLNEYDSYERLLNLTFYSNSELSPPQLKVLKTPLVKVQNRKEQQSSQTDEQSMEEDNQKQLYKIHPEPIFRNSPQSYISTQVKKQINFSYSPKCVSENHSITDEVKVQKVSSLKLQQSLYSKPEKTKSSLKAQHKQHKQKPYLETQLEQCKECEKMLCNAANKLWKNKKLVKYLKAYRKLQQQYDQIKEFLQYVPKSISKRFNNQKKISSMKQKLQQSSKQKGIPKAKIGLEKREQNQKQVSKQKITEKTKSNLSINKVDQSEKATLKGQVLCNSKSKLIQLSD